MEGFLEAGAAFTGTIDAALDDACGLVPAVSWKLGPSTLEVAAFLGTAIVEYMLVGLFTID